MKCVPVTTLSGRFMTLSLRNSSEASSEMTTSERDQAPREDEQWVRVGACVCCVGNRVQGNKHNTDEGKGVLVGRGQVSLMAL